MRTLVTTLTLLFLGLAAHGQSNPWTAQLLFKGEGSGEQAGTGASGQAVAALMLNETMDTARIHVQATGLTGPITDIHIHEAPMGQDGPVVKGLGEGLSGNQVKETWAVNDSIIRNLLMERYYVNIHTAEHPAGEVRAQLKLSQEDIYTATLTSDDHNNNSPAEGVVVARLGLSKNYIDVMAVFDSLSSDATDAHFHKGQPGQSGGVLIGLSDSLTQHSIMTRVDLASHDNKQEFLDSLRKGSIYLNVHTANNQGGEIRGNLTHDPHAIYTCSMPNNEEAGLSTSMNGKGVGYTKLDPTLDTLTYNIAFAGLTGDPTKAHFHRGAKGESGPVKISLTSGIQEYRIAGEVIEPSKTNIADMLRGMHYLNIHTSMNPDGEIRGQVAKATREGHAFELCGGQHDPKVNTDARGVAFVAIGNGLHPPMGDPKVMDMEFGIVVDSLSSSFNNAHIHKAAMGNSGGVVYGLSNFFDFQKGVAFGKADKFSTSDSTNNMLLMDIIEDSAYINVHTANHPSGELRGQIIDGKTCTIVTSLSNKILENNSQLFFANDQIQLRYEGKALSEGQLQVFDASGRQVARHKMPRLQPNSTYTWPFSEKPGFYVVRLHTQNGATFTKKLVVR